MKVSIVIPTFNRKDQLERAVASVFAQTRKADQTIVVDDGSSDRTVDYLQAKFPNLSVLHQEHGGVSKARNLGIQHADHEWIAFLDSDDEWLPRKLERQMDALEKQPGYKICHSDEIWIRNGRRVNPMAKHQKKGGWIFIDCLPLCAISPSAAIVHRDAFDAVGYFDEYLPACEDYDLWLRITSRFKVLYIDQALLIKYGGHSDQLSRRYWGMDRFRIQALEKILASGQLDPAQYRAASQTLVKMAKILLNGARKRNRSEDALRYHAICERYEISE